MFYPYPKIRNIYWRDMEGTKKVVQGSYENPTFAYLKDCPWEATLKLDGMNVGLVWDGHNMSWQGRTESTNFAETQRVYLEGLLTNEWEEILEQKFGEEPAVVYGELIGKGIQACGSKYSDGYRFVIFDVYRPEANQWWGREGVDALATALGLESVPVVEAAPLAQLVELVRERQQDPMAKDELEWEGLVARPMIELKDNKTRVICKIKVRDVCEEDK